jgi:hypothetical protein
MVRIPMCNFLIIDIILVYALKLFPQIPVQRLRVGFVGQILNTPKKEVLSFLVKHFSPASVLFFGGLLAYLVYRHIFHFVQKFFFVQLHLVLNTVFLIISPDSSIGLNFPLGRLQISHFPQI